MNIAIKGLGNQEICGATERVKFKVRGEFSDYYIEHAVVIKNLNLPSQSVENEIIQKIIKQEGINIAPYNNAQITILLGQDNWPLLNILEIHELHETGIVFSRTLLGWSVHGYVEERRQKGKLRDIRALHVAQEVESVEQHEYERFDKLIEDYFKQENLGITDPSPKSGATKHAMRILEKTTRKIGKRWESGLIWKIDVMPSVDSKTTALKRLYSLEAKLDREPEFASLYYKEMERLITLGYAKKIDPKKTNERIWYLPHFGVQNKNKPGKVRLVFDAAARTKGVSLNDLLETGPDLLESLIGVLLRFRQYAYAVKSDIKDMYRCIDIIERDRGAQRFLWRGTKRDGDPDEYESITVFFGSKSAPCTALYVKNKNAERFVKVKPIAVNSVKKKFYMDDYLDSGQSIEETKERVRDVTLINREANFAMHGWASNNEKILESINEDRKLETNEQANLCDEEERVLGLYWNRVTDSFSFNVGLNKLPQEIIEGKSKPTKRAVFSTSMSVYDPLGILAPFTIQSKLIMQDIWRSGINWNSKIREEEFEKWVSWVKNLREIQNCHIPRCFMPTSANPLLTQLHIFCDASLQAYAAVAYLRVIDVNNKIQLTLVMAKTRLAPIKPMTIPRLELQAALLAAKMSQIIEKEIDFAILERIFWSDSTTVLQWIKTDPKSKQMFVANRLGEIAEITRPTEWRWVPSKLNPADDATRFSKEVLKSTDRWCTGPTFLKEPPESWPKEKALDRASRLEIDKLEKRKDFIGVVQIKEIQIPTCIRLFGWHGLIEWAKRLQQKVEKWKNKAKNTRGLTFTTNKQQNFDPAKFWYREIQRTCFPDEIKTLEIGKEIAKKSKIAGLNPFLDQEGIMRAKGRVSRFEGGNFQNQPVILDACHFATKILISFYHRKFFHANNESIINELRQQFYIVGLRARLRWLAQKCITCILRRGKPQNPLMADLPLSRIAFGLRPFTHCGVDYFGPMWVKIGRRREKRWGALFTCMSTRAIHLEIAATLTADSTIMAIQRLASRRGHPTYLYSDNAGNFKRADKELQIAVKEIDTSKQKNFAKSRQIVWKFNAPECPHAGGAWERLIRSVKTALKQTLKERTPTEEVLWTLLREIEHMVNSRPLTHVSVDPNDEEALTPNHILIGSSSGYLRLDKYELQIINPRKHFQIVQELSKCFWKRWLREYLPTLLPRTKWNTSSLPLNVGDIVQILDFQAPRNEWKVGKIVDVYPGADGIVRVAKVKVGKQEYVRATQKLVKIFATEKV